MSKTECRTKNRSIGFNAYILLKKIHFEFFWRLRRLKLIFVDVLSGIRKAISFKNIMQRRLLKLIRKINLKLIMKPFLHFYGVSAMKSEILIRYSPVQLADLYSLHRRKYLLVNK